MDDLTQILATRLRQIRNERDWTQEDLAERAGISARYIGDIERQYASPTVKVLGRLAKALGVSPGELLTRRRR
jgi:transcriptional regulator with XRE-family HTH domain